jgi:Arm DNA-binding domain/DnaB-like helicase C terminal domain
MVHGNDLNCVMLEREKEASGNVRIIWDSEVKGFGARLQPQGIAFLSNYRHGPFERWMTIGSPAELTVEQARRRAADLKLAVRAGADPLEEIRAKRKAAERGVSLSTVVEKWTAACRSEWSSDTARLYAFQAQNRTLDLLVVDHVHKMRHPGARSKVEEVTEISARLAEIPKRLNCAMLVLARLSRQSDQA